MPRIGWPGGGATIVASLRELLTLMPRLRATPPEPRYRTGRLADVLTTSGSMLLTLRRFGKAACGNAWA